MYMYVARYISQAKLARIVGKLTYLVVQLEKLMHAQDESGIRIFKNFTLTTLLYAGGGWWVGGGS